MDLAVGYVYSLCDPRDGDPFYVGATTKPLATRLSQHIADAKWPFLRRHKHRALSSRPNGGPKAERIREILRQANEPLISILATVEAPLRDLEHILREYEREWIESLRPFITNSYEARPYRNPRLLRGRQ